MNAYFSGTITSYQQMLGQLQDRGNVSTIAHYLDILEAAGFIKGLQKFSPANLRQKASSPKLQVFNTALISTQTSLCFQETLQNREIWKKLEYNAIGAHLINSICATDIELYYWKEGGREIDFILQKGEKVVTFEVKTGQNRIVTNAKERFAEIFHPTRQLTIGPQGISTEEFLLTCPTYWLK